MISKTRTLVRILKRQEQHQQLANARKAGSAQPDDADPMKAGPMKAGSALQPGKMDCSSVNRFPSSQFCLEDHDLEAEGHAFGCGYECSSL